MVNVNSHPVCCFLHSWSCWMIVSSKSTLRGRQKSNHAINVITSNGAHFTRAMIENVALCAKGQKVILRSVKWKFYCSSWQRRSLSCGASGLSVCLSGGLSREGAPRKWFRLGKLHGDRKTLDDLLDRGGWTNYSWVEFCHQFMDPCQRNFPHNPTS
jgi:hypothetical protein